MLLHMVGRKNAAGLVGAGVNAAAQFLLVVVVTRTLDTAAAGTFFTITAAMVMLAGVLRLDAGNGLIYFRARTTRVPKFRDMEVRGQPATASPSRPLLWVALAPVVLGSVAAGAGLASGSAMILPAALVLPFVVVADVLVSATRGRGSMRPTLLLDGLLQPIGQLVLVTVAVLAGAPFPVILLAWALPAIPVTLLAARQLARRPYGSVTWPEFWRYTAPRSVAAAIQAVFQRLDIVLVALLAGPAQAAIYTAATRFRVVGQLVSQGLAQAVQPRLVRAMADGDPAEAWRAYRRATRTLIVLTWPLWVGYAAFAPWILQLFGPGYPQAADIALVLSITMLVATGCGLVDVVLIAAGRTTTSLVNTAAAVGTTVLLDLLLVPGLGALGAALGWSGGVLVKNLLPLAQITRSYAPRVAA
ncbi:lipopolysaccharide biosynthesis protein [Acrocarpospora catenulata]|uniref:lipopolysaccharide biosynthesis protein n=1 Tax=Acrocarpospora catenulata TaxID=2836182 RepID=UPI001BDA8D85|nr:lipopolysaccharide biosynthesis protein [Acrocarpospora catenulata]